MRYFDCTQPITDGMPVYPGDPAVTVRPVARIAEGASANLCVVTLGTHTGTHLDAPAHFFDGAEGVDRVPLETLIGPARVVEIPTAGPIDVKSVRDLPGAGCRRLLLKTRNSALPHPLRYRAGYAALTEAAARRLAGAGLVLLGLDGPSPDPAEAEECPAHRALLGAGVVILEGLELSAVPPGEYELLCLPLLVQDADGAPARVVLRRLGEPPGQP